MKKHLPEEENLNVWGRLAYWVSQHQALSRLFIILVGLIVFLIFLPATIRIVLWHGLQSHKILAGMLLVFSMVAISLVWSSGQRLDVWIFLLFNMRGPRPAWLDKIMLAFTQLGSGIAALVIALLLYLVGEHILSYEFVLGSLTLWLTVELFKFIVQRSRPFIRLAQARIVGYRAIGRSFPSGHTSQVFFLATLTIQHFQLSVWIAILLYGIALFVGITRMYVGAHYPRDILAGAILGSVWGALIGLADGYVMSR
jgi:membrane-associated phospholipid phosphatase